MPDTQSLHNTSQLEDLLAASSALHGHLCPRQVLGVRMGMLAAQLLQIQLPQTGKRVLTIVETDGCFADGVAVAANCWVGHRTMRVEDYGKVAATFVDTVTNHAYRMAPHPGARSRAATYVPDAPDSWHTMLEGYQRMPAEELLVAQAVRLCTPVADLISHAGLRVECEQCGEEIINEREVSAEGQILCRACAGPSYYGLVHD